jgi:hypothetical protein
LLLLFPLAAAAGDDLPGALSAGEAAAILLQPLAAQYASSCARCKLQAARLTRCGAGAGGTPRYNQLLLEDAFVAQHQDLLARLLGSAPALRDAILMLKVRLCCTSRVTTRASASVQAERFSDRYGTGSGGRGRPRATR